MRFFFYGTLMDPEVRSLVLPHLAAQLELWAAVLPGYRRLASADGAYPVLVRASRAGTAGLLAQGFDEAALWRMAHFEGPGYLPHRCLAVAQDGRRVPASVFLPRSPRQISRRPWSYRLWLRRDKRQLLRATAAWMEEIEAGRPPASDLDWLARRRLLALARLLEVGADSRRRLGEAA